MNVSFAKEKHDLDEFKSKYMSEGEWDLIDVSAKYLLFIDNGKTIGKLEYIVSMN